MTRLILLATVVLACSCYSTSEVHPGLDGDVEDTGDDGGDAKPADDADDLGDETDPPDADDEETRPPITHRRVLVVMDQSASLQCTDPGLIRDVVFTQLLDEIRVDPNARLGYVGFHADLYSFDFRIPDVLMADSTDARLQMGPASDYQGALTAAYEILEESMDSTTETIRERTAYEIHFFSDGTPEPRCDAGCEDDIIYCSDGIDNDGDGLSDEDDEDCAEPHPDGLYPALCNDTIDWEELDSSTYYDHRTRCGAYNTDEQILEKIQMIRELGDRYSVGSTTFNTNFLFAETDVVSARCGGSACAFGYEWVETEERLQAMAEEGGGAFTDVHLSLGLFEGPREIEDSESCNSGGGTWGISYAYECDNRFGTCGTPEQSGGGFPYPPCWEEPEYCEEECSSSGGTFFIFDHISFCACPPPLLSGPRMCLSELTPYELCMRPGGAWSVDSDDAQCTCHPDYLFVSTLNKCMNREYLMERCDENDGSWAGDEDLCQCPTQETYLFEYNGCVSPTDVGTVCDATGGTWLETTEWWTCFCPDGRSMMNGNCLSETI